ncbi:pyridoxamine 5'-phosphate oxidase family protein [Methylobacterium sp. W2]|uniref:pyridoxamine 5'-phosphate oxidase family protein n=1 Tax=Methylobacterium sp. W2 TaxID=2598107 RepID=UPI001D0C708C|nr:pyridoxamine 5'-phosphate oxidase family protein [Methylobacterium sp. W2]MCC0807147.1 pyridoxamine 5'-phosphate oxidase family protein [Methylobacterium sp. W2]
MAKQFPALDERHREFIARQHIVFTASAAEGTRINLSPRGTDTFRVIDPNTVVYLDRTGSGNETAAHLRADGRLTLMFCAFEGAPTILRLYGCGEVLARGSEAYSGLLSDAFDGWEPSGARQMVRLVIDLVQTSCGFGVPLFDYREERPTLDRWAQAKTEAELDAYRRQKNARSLDGLPTGLFADEDVAG